MFSPFFFKVFDHLYYHFSEFFFKYFASFLFIYLDFYVYSLFLDKVEFFLPFGFGPPKFGLVVCVSFVRFVLSFFLFFCLFVCFSSDGQG